MAWFKSAEVMLNLHRLKEHELWFYYFQLALSTQQKKLVDDIISMEAVRPQRAAYQVLG
jgi:hypothetical protein